MSESAFSPARKLLRGAPPTENPIFTAAKKTVRPATGGPTPASTQAPTLSLEQPQPSSQPPATPSEPSTLPDDLQMERSRVAPGMYKPVPETTVFEWTAPSRPFKKHNRQFFVTVTTIALLVSLILFFSGQFLPIAVLVSVLFLVYVLQVIPPHDIRHRVTTYGIHVEGNLYYWEELGRFWFETKGEQLLLLIETIRFPGRITLVFPAEHRQIMAEILSEVLLQQKPDLTFFEKVSQWIQERVPLE